MKKLILCLLTWISAALSACDDGRIYSERDPGTASGVTAVMRGEISGCAGYSSQPGYSVALAAFGDDDFALVSKPVGDGSVEVTLSGIPAEARTVEVCLISRLRERIHTFASADVDGKEGAMTVLEAGRLDVGMYGVVAGHIFTARCAQCHGATGHSAADLDLTPEMAYASLVGVPSTVEEDAVRVTPGRADASTLWRAVATSESESWAFNHAVLLDDRDKDLIRDWINSGAEK